MVNKNTGTKIPYLYPMIKIMTIIGARPQFIKAAAVSKAIGERPGINEVMVHTGQHFDDNMSQVFFDQMGIPRPDYNLNIHSLSHGAMTGRMTEEIEKVLQQEKPDWVMVYGDTNSTLAGALAAVKMHIPVAHVEAGLRSFNMNMPEEINRILTDRISKLLFCPSQVAVDNLLGEGFEKFPCRLVATGDVMYDASLLFKEKAVCPAGLKLFEGFVLATVHREENTNDEQKLKSIMDSIQTIARHQQVVFPVHPRTRKLMKKYGISEPGSGITLLDPVGYLEILYLLDHCSMVFTDSGGMQKEAYFFRKPCVTLREETEWTELTRAGYNILAGSQQEKIEQAYMHFMKQSIAFEEGLYGKGNASGMIAEAFLSA